MSSIHFDDLEPEEQAKVRELLEPIDPKKAAKSAGARLRRKTGEDFESELDITHSYYEYSRFGKIRRNWVPTKVVGKPRRGFIQQRVVVAPADVDRTGWVRVHVHYDEAKARATNGTDVNVWEGSATSGQVIPVGFDAKVLSESGGRRGWYFHDVGLQHQLHSLKAAADVGEYAFLLVLDRTVGRAFGIPIQPHLVALLSGAGVQLYERGESPRWIMPSITKRGHEIGWDWIPLLQHMVP